MSRQRHRVVQELVARGVVEVSLVRWVERRRLAWLNRPPPGEREVLYRQRFPAGEMVAIDSYYSLLERVIRHIAAGTYGCFVTADALPDGRVRVELYERRLDGGRLRCESLAERDFDASADDATAASAEFATELRVWAEHRNAEREHEDIEHAAERAASDSRAGHAADERDRAARELAAILTREQ